MLTSDAINTRLNLSKLTDSGHLHTKQHNIRLKINYNYGQRFDGVYILISSKTPLCDKLTSRHACATVKIGHCSTIPFSKLSYQGVFFLSLHATSITIFQELLFILCSSEFDSSQQLDPASESGSSIQRVSLAAQSSKWSDNLSQRVSDSLSQRVVRQFKLLALMALVSRAPLAFGARQQLQRRQNAHLLSPASGRRCATGKLSDFIAVWRR